MVLVGMFLGSAQLFVTCSTGLETKLNYSRSQVGPGNEVGWDLRMRLGGTWE